MNSASVQPSNCHLDLEELKTRCLGRLDLVERLLSRFQQSMDDDLEQLDKAIQAESTNEIGQLAHRMKGSSLTVGAHGISEAANRLEASATTNQMQGIEALVSELKRERSLLDELISNQA